MSRSQAELLHALYDGELADDERSEVRTRLSADDERRVQSLKLMGDLIREAGEPAAYDADQLFARIVAEEPTQLSQLEDHTLQQLFDGELDGDLLKSAERQSETDPRIEERLASLGALGDLVRDGAHALPEYDADDLFARILSGAAEQGSTESGATSSPGLRMIEGGRTEPSKPSPALPSNDRERPAAESDEGSSYGWVAAAIALAAAALLGFFLLRPSDAPPVAQQDDSPTEQIEPGPELDPAPIAPAVEDDLGSVAGDSLDVLAQAAIDRATGRFGSEVEEVDFGSNTGTVFAVEGEHGEQYAVVWINDDEPELL